MSGRVYQSGGRRCRAAARRAPEGSAPRLPLASSQTVLSAVSAGAQGATVPCARPPRRSAPPAVTDRIDERISMKRVTAVIIAALALLGIVAGGLFAAGCGNGGVPSDAVATVGGDQHHQDAVPGPDDPGEGAAREPGSDLPRQGLARPTTATSRRSSTTWCSRRSWPRAPARSTSPSATRKSPTRSRQIEKAYGRRGEGARPPQATGDDDGLAQAVDQGPDAHPACVGEGRGERRP